MVCDRGYSARGVAALLSGSQLCSMLKRMSLGILQCGILQYQQPLHDILGGGGGSTSVQDAGISFLTATVVGQRVIIAVSSWVDSTTLSL